MEKLMDHCGNVAAERKLRTPGSKQRRGWWRPASRLVAACELEHGKRRLANSKRREDGGGVRVRAWQAAAGQQQDSLSLMACMALVASLTMDLSCFCMLQRCRARVTEGGGGVRAADRMLQLPSSKRSPARVTEDCGGVRAADCMLGVSGSVAEAGGGVRAADGNLPLPSRRFMDPEVGQSWRY
ncbi:hypothetical protein PF002_g26366 [Phytophthora fragariae]|uniref:Uncharacterized protein n=1 Tax=Phytophthora fragariae TaxID=53985 RepID=A0A6A3WGD6_9STRA|nr:hypothetical protein PF002_g26366 [Phytophthora fragariae]